MILKRWSSILLALALCLSLVTPAFAEGETVQAPTREEAARTAAQTAAQYGAATSVQYALWEDGKITLEGHTGVYSKTENRALTADTLYGIGSVSKIYTTAAVMKLVEEAKISLDTPVTQYLPAFQMADERYQKITVRMLLNHSSGLLGSSTNDAFLLGDTDQVATKTLLARLATQELKAEPGAMSVYCNDGFTLAELVVEAVSGKSFTDFVHEKLLAPLGLSQTFTPQDRFDRANLAKIYQTAEETRALPSESLGVIGTGGIYASASDLAAFGGALATDQILKASSTAAMQNAEYKRGLWPSDEVDGMAYGLGYDSVKAYPFATSGIPALSKSGDTIYYHAALLILPEHNMAAAVLSSGGVSTFNQQVAARMLIDALAAKGITVDETAPTLPAATAAVTLPAELQKYAGYYGNTTQQFQITLNDKGVLTLHTSSTPSAPNQVFQYHSDGSFRDAAGTALLRFVPEKNGLLYLYQKSITPLPGLGYIPTSQYVAQALPANELSAEVTSEWDRIARLPMLPVNIKYSSVMYHLLMQSLQGTEQPESIPGYVTGLRIVDKTLAQNIYQIPTAAGRDSQEIEVFEEEGALHYRTPQGIIWREATDLATLYANGSARCSIAPSGAARWYSVAAADAGKTMTVHLGEESAFYVYDAKGTVVASSHLYGDKTAKLPEGGMLVFAGKAGAQFTLSFAS